MLNKYYLKKKRDSQYQVQSIPFFTGCQGRQQKSFFLSLQSREVGVARKSKDVGKGPGRAIRERDGYEREVPLSSCPANLLPGSWGLKWDLPLTPHPCTLLERVLLKSC